jgi:tRNA pseudouridine38-40 synthase
MNFKLLIQYDGTDFHGWQTQDELRTVQGELTKALSIIEGQPVTVNGSGRTDAGVHAEGQVASVKLEREITPEKLRSAVNGNIGKDVRVIDVCQMSDDFHARYSAQGKTYVYRVINAPVLSPFWLRYALQEARELDLTAMQNCARLFIGEHDWTAFSAAHSDADSRIREVTELSVSSCRDSRAHAPLIEVFASASGFLRYMVRSIVGTLLAAGRGELTEETVRQAIDGGDRSLVGATAPAHGLTLMKVDY